MVSKRAEALRGATAITPPRRMIPKPHMLKSIRARNWNLTGAVLEFIDNSVMHGRATEVVVIIDNKNGILVADNGIGMNDPSRVFWYGLATDYSNFGNLGQFGVGAKNASIWLGDIVTVQTTHKGLKREMSVDWSEVERQGEWPEEYSGEARPAVSKGTQITVRKLARHFKLESSQNLAKEIGFWYGPGLRSKKLSVVIYHKLTNGTEQQIAVEPWSPGELTEVINIKGEFQPEGGPVLRWKGQAGLSETLVERYAAVHISFVNRVVELTREPYKGETAPTLYVEVQLDPKTPWKHQLSEHKDKIVNYREELSDSIHAEIKEILAKSAKQADHLVLKGMTFPIEAALNKALKAAGILHVNEDDEAEPGGHGDGEGGGVGEGGGANGKNVRPVCDEGVEAKPHKPRGVQIRWTTAEKLDGKAFSWLFSGPVLEIRLDEAMFKPTFKWPPTLRDRHIIFLVVGFIATALEAEYFDGDALRQVLTPTLRKRIEAIADEHGERISPFLYREILPN